MKTTTRAMSALLATAMGLGLGCLGVRPNPDHCIHADGDRTCADRYPDERTFCSSCGPTPGKDGCVAEVAPECHAPCGRLEDGEVCGGSESTSSGGGSEASSGSSESSGSSSEGSSTTGPMRCESDEACKDVEAPFCEPVSGECVACDGMADPDGACAGEDPFQPLCVAGTCVACTPEDPVVCDEQRLLCDGTTNACVPCTEHGQCGSGACELAVGTCFPPGRVVHVDGDGEPLPTQRAQALSVAIADVAPNTHGIIVVHELDGGAFYGPVFVDGGRIIALFAAAGEAPMIQGYGGNTGMSVEDDGTALYMDGIQIRGSDGPGLRVSGAYAWVDRSRIVQNSGGGVVAEAGAELVLRNCFVTAVGNGVSAVVLSDADASILYSSAFSSAFAPTAAVNCLGATNLVLRNSLVVTEGGAVGNELACAGGEVTYSATEALVPGEGNVAVGAFPDGVPQQWFVDVSSGDLRLQDQGLTIFADVAQWTVGDPPTDIDGDARPAVDGTPDYAGADVP